MLFPSEIFLFVFLPFVVVIYYGLLRKSLLGKNIFLLLASLFFYAWGRPKHVLIMIASIIMNYLFGIAIDKFRDKKKVARLILVLMVLCNLGILGIFKYTGFAVSQFNRFLHTNLAVHVFDLPIGISFFTFQAMSYVIDVYRGNGKVQKNPLYVGLYISLFPQLIAGPIVRYETIADQMEHRVENLEDFTSGINRFCIGLGKKVLLANNLAIIADASFDLIYNGQYISTVSMAWLGAIAYSLQIFFDFSGYSDMAIGLGKMFGFHFHENFQYPYISSSITDFWRRWHISLSSWFRDYVYIPLGGSRVTKPVLIRNLFIVWLLTGIWHGANWTFIMWGLMYFVLLTFEKLTGLHRKNTWWSHIYALLFVILGWVIFRSVNLGNAVCYIKAMFGIGARGIYDKTVTAYLKQYWIFLIAAIFGSMPIIPALNKRFMQNKIWHAVCCIGMIFVLVLSISYIANNAYNPFIYFNF